MDRSKWYRSYPHLALLIDHNFTGGAVPKGMAPFYLELLLFASLRLRGHRLNCHMFYLAKTPGWIKRFYNESIWAMPTREKILYLSFDDGPHPTITDLVLDELKKYNAKASFFCIGNNVLKFPEVYERIIRAGHTVGNHSFSHINGWKTADAFYLEDIAEAKKHIDSNLYRPPYGKITKYQLKQLSLPRFNLKTVMWSVLSGDFDTGISPEKCLENVLHACEPGSIVVFHDSEKAYDRMRYALSGLLEHYSREGYRFERIIL